MTNFTLSDFYNPTTISITKILMDLACLFQVFVVPFILYAVIKNQNMKIYRWYLVNEIVWNSLLVFCFAFVSPSMFGVYPIVLVNSFFEDWLDINSWYVELLRLDQTHICKIKWHQNYWIWAMFWVIETKTWIRVFVSITQNIVQIQ